MCTNAYIEKKSINIIKRQIDWEPSFGILSIRKFVLIFAS